MQYETRPTPDGNTTIRVAGKFLHSAYNPDREATRILDRFVLEHRDGVVIVIGEGVPYFSRLLVGRYPGLKVIAVTFHDNGENPHETIQRISITHPIELDIRRQVRESVSLFDISRVQAFLWPPASHCIPEWAEIVQRGVVQGVRDSHSELVTVASFGMTWLRNAISRSVWLDERWIPQIQADAAVISAGGPSATAAFDTEILRHLDPVVIAASSAADALRRVHYAPDMLIHTDAGFWAKRYRRPVPTVVTIRSSVPAGGLPLPEICIRSGWIGDVLASDAEEWPMIGEFPTVAGTSIAYADTVLPAGTTLFLTGFDLCSYDLVTHARPHPNDRYIDSQTHRLQPEMTIRALRAGMLTDQRPLTWHDGTRGYRSPSLSAFFQPVSALIKRTQSRRTLYNLSPAPTWEGLDFQRYPTAPTGNPGSKTSSRSVTFTRISRPPNAERRRHVMAVLRRWYEMIDTRAPSENARTLLLHLSPVEMLAATRGEMEYRHAASAGKKELSAYISRVKENGGVRE